MKNNQSDGQTINFSHLNELWNLFPYSCSSGYYFLWNFALSSPKEEKKAPKDAREIVREKLRSYRRS